MTQHKICLASDNCCAVHPDILQAIIEANEGFAISYGADAWTAEVEKLMHNAFNATSKVFMVPSGTAANVFSLKLSCKRYESVICTDIAHLNYQECGSAESIVGCKLLSVPHQNGKITPLELTKILARERAFGKHSTIPRVLCLTQPTEFGTVYTLSELETLAQIAQKEHLLIHMDGSRLYNAAVHLNTSLAAIIQAAHVDILSLGGTKNGLLCAEAVLIFNPLLQEGSDHVHKQTLCLVSKMRYLSAQFIPFFKNNLWSTLALHANQQAAKIAACLAEVPELTLNYPVETNQIFFTAPSEWIPLIQEKILCYPWDYAQPELRLITSWNTTEREVEEVRAFFNNLSQ